MVLENIKIFAKSFMTHESHDYSHVNRVYKLVDKVSLNMKNVGRLVLLTATVLHDIARANETNHVLKYDLKQKVGFNQDQVGKCHAKIGALWATNYLKTIDFPQNKFSLWSKREKKSI